MCSAQPPGLAGKLEITKSPYQNFFHRKLLLVFRGATITTIIFRNRDRYNLGCCISQTSTSAAQRSHLPEKTRQTKAVALIPLRLRPLRIFLTRTVRDSVTLEALLFSRRRRRGKSNVGMNCPVPNGLISYELNNNRSGVFSFRCNLRS